MILYYIFVFLFGSVVGSFLNVVILRLESGEPIVNSRSHCVKCGHVLGWHELIPVFSFLVQKGRCRACGKGISWQYPLVEIGTGLMFLLVLIFVPSGHLPQGDNFQFSSLWEVYRMETIFNEFSNFSIFKLVYLFVISSAMVVLFVYDLRHYILPDKILFPVLGVVFMYRVAEFWSLSHWNLIENWSLPALRSFSEVGKIENLRTFELSLFSALGASVFFAMIFVLSRGRGLGFGDVKFAFFMGLFLGWPNIIAGLFISWILGGIISIGLLICGKKGLKSKIPFGPFLVVGTFVAMLWGDRLIQWYLGFLGFG